MPPEGFCHPWACNPFHSDNPSGLRCWGHDGQCNGEFGFPEIREFLQGHPQGVQAFSLYDKRKFGYLQAKSDKKTRWFRRSSPKAPPPSPPTPPDPHTLFRNRILECFTLRCPRCRFILTDRINGCNAAVCDACNCHFCFLCLHKSWGHAHSDRHSGGAFEYRDALTSKDPNKMWSGRYTEQLPWNPKKGYTFVERFHWLLWRAQLQALFSSSGEADLPAPEIQRAVLGSLNNFFAQRKMFPFPEGGSRLPIGSI